MKIDATDLDYRVLNERIRAGKDEHIVIENCIGQRFIGAACKTGVIEIHGTPGNAQDAVGDTANDGRIIVYGSIGDAAGYAVRGGKVFVRGDAGYRAGVHMKEYGERHPYIVVGGSAGSFLGEYLAGGTIIILNLRDQPVPLGAFTGTGMHGGRILVRCAETESVPLIETLSKTLPEQVAAVYAEEEEIRAVSGLIAEFCQLFSADFYSIINSRYILLTPNARNPYKKLYAFN